MTPAPAVPRVAVRELLIDGQRVNIASKEQAIREIFGELERSSASFLIGTLNLDHLVKRRTSPEFKAAYDKARFVTADGFPIVTLAKLHGHAMERTAGSDLVVPLCRAAADAGYSVYLFGSSDDTLVKASRYLTSIFPGLTIAGTHSPPFGFDPASKSAVDLMSRIGSSGARLCLVALGAPAQELFSARALLRTKGVAFIGVGASLDFLAGNQRRSPRLLQALNLEWAWRLALSPRRLWLRYLRCGLLFLRLLGGELIGRRPVTLAEPEK